MSTTIDWLTKSSSDETRDTAKRVTDIAVLREALAIVAGKEKTKAKYIEARIKQLERIKKKEAAA